MIRLRSIAGAGLMALLFVLPLVLSLLLLIPGLVDKAAFAAALSHPQFYGAVLLTLSTGLVSTVLSLLFAIVILSSLQQKLSHRTAWFLAVPHLALALGLGFLIAPTGLLSRLVATVFTGWPSPPNWQTVQDADGIGLIIALVLKETPFLLWAMAQVLAQDELRQRFTREMAVARSFGHSEASAFYRVLLPQILSRVTWPIVAVFSYGLTVVDMALVIGPGQPPTLAQLVWTDLNDGEVAAASRGAAGTLLLSGGVMLLLALCRLVLRLSKPLQRRWMTSAPVAGSSRVVAGWWLWQLWLAAYAFVIVALMLQSISLHWPFPNLLATAFSLKAWWQFLLHFSPILNSLLVGLMTSLLALMSCLVWFETQPPTRDRWILAAATAVLCLPALLLALGQYRLLLQMGLTGSFPGLVLVHLLYVQAYMFVMLHGLYRGYDPRWRQMSQGLAASRFRFLWAVKRPMLKAPLLSALAVGFAVSVAQYVPTQLAAAGRYSTLPVEAVTLSAGGNRALISVAALLLMLLPLLAFQVASRAGKPRWGHL